MSTRENIIKSLERLTKIFEHLVRRIGRIEEERDNKETNHSDYDEGSINWWRATLMTMTEMVKSQRHDLSPEQIEYMNKRLFGGMGSLLDLYLTDCPTESDAKWANKKIMKELSILSDVLDAVEHSGDQD